MKTLFIGQHYIEHPTIDSTNSYASELIKKSNPIEGTLICSFNQQNGRGQRGNTWYSEPNKNAALSYILHPNFLSPIQQFILTKMTSLAVADLMTEILDKHSKTSEINIKWPNDIYVGGKKIAGILIENTLNSNSIKSSVIGIGININQLIFPELHHATSLKQITKNDFDLHQLVERLCEFMEVRYLQLTANKTAQLNQEYLNYLFQRNQWKTYTTNGLNFEGKIRGVSSIGKLEVQLFSGEIREFDLKEIGFNFPI